MLQNKGWKECKESKGMEAGRRRLTQLTKQGSHELKKINAKQGVYSDLHHVIYISLSVSVSLQLRFL